MAYRKRPGKIGVNFLRKGGAQPGRLRPVSGDFIFPGIRIGC
jgi:hypothetical protein